MDLKDKASGEHQIYMGNSTYCDWIGEGTCKIETNCYVLVLKDVLYALNICRNLISMSVLGKKGFDVRFKSGSVYIRKDEKIIVKGDRVNDMYLINNNTVSFSEYMNVSFDTIIYIFGI